MSIRISLRNLTVVLLAAAGLSIVPVGVANAWTRELAEPELTCRYGDTAYHDAAVLRFDDGSYRCDNGRWISQSGTNIDNRFG